MSGLLLLGDNKMKKAEVIERYGEDAWAKHLAKRRERYAANPEEEKAHNQNINRKGGKYYEHKLEYDQIGLRGLRQKIRNKHAKRYRPYKKIIAPDSQIHHEWIPPTAEYRGVALVESNPHMYGIIDVIQILDGEITLLTEEEIKNFIP